MRCKHVCFLVLGILSSCTPKVAVQPEIPELPEDPAYLFSIESEPVMADEFLRVFSKNQSVRNNSDPVSQEEFDKNLELFIDFKLKVKEAENQGMSESEEFEKEFHMIKEDLKKPYLLKNAVQEGELRKAYNRMQEMLEASHILLAFPPNAGEADSIAVLKMAASLKEKAEGGMDFNELAVEYSDDPSAKNNKGYLGYFTSLQMVYPFEDAAYLLEPGQISGPVLSNFGYHLIKLEDRGLNPGQIRVSHILVRVDPADPVSEERAKRRIEDIYTALQQPGYLWEEIVATYSDDESTKKTGGMLPWFGVGSIIPAFEQAAFSLSGVGDISVPVKTPFGYHFVRLEGTRPLAPFEEMEEALKSKILRDGRSGLIQSQVMAMQIARYGFKENKEILDTLRGMVDQVLPKGTTQLYDKPIEPFLERHLMVVQQDSFSVGDFIDFIQEDTEVVKVGPGQYFDPWYQKFKEVSLNHKEEEELLKGNKEYRNLVKEYREGILLFSLMNEAVWQKALTDSAGQMTYYIDHRDRYQWPDRIPALIVKMAKTGPFTKVWEFLKDKEYDQTLKPKLEDRFLNDRPSLFDTEEGVYVIAEDSVLKKLDVNIKHHEVKGDRGVVFFVLGDIIPSGPMGFEETKGKVIQDYQEHLNEELVKNLRIKYSIQINEDEKKRISEMVVKG